MALNLDNYYQRNDDENQINEWFALQFWIL